MSTEFTENDVRKSENDYSNISKNFPLVAVYFQTLDGGELNFQYIMFIPNEAAFKDAIKDIVQWAQQNGHQLKTDKKNMLYYGHPDDMYEEMYFIEGSKDGAGLTWFSTKELNEYQPIRTKWNKF